MTCETATRLRPALTLTNFVTVPLASDVWDAARKYAREQGIKPETAVAEAARSYFLGDKE